MRKIQSIPILLATVFLACNHEPKPTLTADTLANERARNAIGGKNDLTSITGAWDRLHRVYATPISFDADPEIGRATTTPFTFQFDIQQNDSLTSNLDRLAALSRGLATWRVINNCVVIMPAKRRDERKSNALDVQVSLQIYSVSTWEALKQLELAINASPEKARVLRIIPAPVYDMKAPFPEFRSAESIHLSLVNVTAREAICAIFSASPIPLAYFYVDAPEGVNEDMLQIIMYRDGKVADDGLMRPDQNAFWDREIRRGIISVQ